MHLNSVLVTGANRGIGLEFVKQFADLPNPPQFIFATCRNPNKAQDLQQIAKANPNVKVLTLDMKDVKKFWEIRQEIEKESGDVGLNLLINNAAICDRTSLDEVYRDKMMDDFEVNTVGPLLLSKELLPLLEKSASVAGNGILSCFRAGIVNISSKMGSIHSSSGGCYPYRASKAALNMVTKSLSIDLVPKGILVLAVHPGSVMTAMGAKNADLTTELSVRGMLNVIFSASNEHCGAFINYDGKRILW